MQKFSKTDINKHLKSIDIAWEINENSLYREFLFKNFNEAFAFMSSVASLAEKLNHHPEWCNSFNKVNISLTTHDAGGVSEKDFIFAKEIDLLMKNTYSKIK